MSLFSVCYHGCGRILGLRGAGKTYRCYWLDYDRFMVYQKRGSGDVVIYGVEIIDVRIYDLVLIYFVNAVAYYTLPSVGLSFMICVYEASVSNFTYLINVENE
jgi:hypothetical protein